MTIFHPSLIFIFFLAGPADSKVKFTGPGWYLLEFKEGHRLTLKVLDQGDGSFRCYYQGANFPMSRHEIKLLIRLAELKRDAAAGSLTPLEEEKIREAIEALASLEGGEAEEAFEFLRKEFTRCRKVLHEALAHREAQVRKQVVKLLGEEGNGDDDLQPLLPLLKDSEDRVRLAAVMALRKLGPKALEAFFEYLRFEPVANHRKMAVKTLARWHRPEAVAPLVERLEEESDAGVRKFITGALKTLTKQDLGEDAEAWKGYLEEFERQKEIERLKVSQEKEGKK
ncbi:MAG: HEAT repeat domain-containing protein [Planctomycetes bacterium]|nr:HEAT repeat domain-containing protein [Planctomycetota bacterium]